MVQRRYVARRTRRVEMRTKKKAAVVIATLAAIGLALPGTASARRLATPTPGVQNTGVVMIVGPSASGGAFDAVSWCDVSWSE
jgi:hypothetical protein